MGSFSLATVADGVLLVAAGLLMAGLACWESWGGRKLGVRGRAGATKAAGAVSTRSCGTTLAEQLADKQAV